MRIISLRIKNFMGISEVEIKPGQVNQLVGSNSQGKTSIIKAIDFAVNGSTDGTLVKLGEDSAEVFLELSDNTHIRRKLSSGGRQNVSVDKDGMKATSPQSYLEGLFESSLFNPIELLDPKRRVEAIMQAIEIKMTPERLAKELTVLPNELPPLDYTIHGLKVLEHAHRYFYQRRAEANKDAAEKKNRWETYAQDLAKQAPPQDINRETVHEERRRNVLAIAELNRKINKITMDIASVEDSKKRVEKQQHIVTLTKSKIEQLQSEIKHQQMLLEMQEKNLQEERNRVPSTMPDPQPLLKQVHEYQLANERLNGELTKADLAEAWVNQKKVVGAMEETYLQARNLAEALTHKVDLLHGPIKGRLMAEAESPVSGLTYDNGNFLVDGVPVDNLSSSQAIKLAIGIARKLAKKAKFICIDGLEALDADTYSAFRSEIEDDGYEYFVSVVGNGFDVKSANDKKFKLQQGAVVQ